MPIKKPRKGRYFYLVTSLDIFRWIGDDGILNRGFEGHIGGQHWPAVQAGVTAALERCQGFAWVHQFETKTLRFVKTMKRPDEPWRVRT